MPSPADCPAIESWQALFDDQLPPDEHEDFERHLESCPACQQRLDRIHEDEGVFRRLGRRVGDPSAGTADPTLDRVRQQLRELIGPERSPSAAGVDLHFLRACARPGALGSLGDYEVEEVIGHGGMGIVLKALDPGLNRHVALKVLAPTLAGNATARLRFTREVKAAAAVRHDHIVTVYGVHEADGLPYLVMEHVAGESLQDRLDRTGPLSPGEVVRIGLQTASALAAAHAHGLIHRDVKPANILLEGGADGDVKIKITDFGLARTADDVGLTRDGVVAGTPEYMAPEQARGQAVDPRADLFSLGCTLYALCTGAPPFRADTTLAVLRQVCEEEPAPLRTRNPAVPAWLEAFVAGLLAKDPADRYPSAAAVVALLEGYEAHLRQPAAVPAPVLPVRKRRWLMRRGAGWPLALALAAVSLAVVLVGLGALGRGLLAAGTGNRAQAAGPPPASRSDVWSVAVTRDGRFLAAGAGWWDGPGEAGVWDLATRKPLHHFADDRGIGSVAFSPDGKLLALGSWTSHVRVLDWADQKEVADLPTAGVARIAFSPDGKLLATVCEDGTAALWDVATGERAADLRGNGVRLQCVTFSPDGRRVLAGGGEWKKGGVNQAVAWDVTGKTQVLKLAGHENTILCTAYAPDGKAIATGSADKTVRLWDAATGGLLATLRGHDGLVEGVAFAPGGKALASASHDHTVRLWDVEQAREKGRIAMPDEVRTVCATPDGTALIAGGARKTLKVFDLATRQELATLWESAGGPQGSMDDLPVSATPAAGGRFWLVMAVVLALSLGLALLVLHLRRRRRDAGTPAGPAPTAAPLVSFQCPDCEKSLKVRPALRGKRVQCPGCGNAVRVPVAGEDQAPSPSRPVTPSPPGPPTR